MVDNLDNFTRAYIVAALWSSTDEEGEPLDFNYDVSDIDPETLACMADDCARFQREHAALLDRAYAEPPYAARVARDGEYYGPEEFAGHDFWLTRCGHGAGFWDRGLGDVGDQLTAAAKAFGDVDLYVGDDGRIYA